MDKPSFSLDQLNESGYFVFLYRLPDLDSRLSVRVMITLLTDKLATRRLAAMLAKWKEAGYVIGSTKNEEVISELSISRANSHERLLEYTQTSFVVLASDVLTVLK